VDHMSATVRMRMAIQQTSTPPRWRCRHLQQLPYIAGGSDRLYCGHTLREEALTPWLAGGEKRYP